MIQELNPDDDKISLSSPERPELPWGHWASYSMDTGSSSPGKKQPGREANHSPPPSAHGFLFSLDKSPLST